MFNQGIRGATQDTLAVCPRLHIISENALKSGSKLDSNYFKHELKTEQKIFEQDRQNHDLKAR